MLLSSCSDKFHHALLQLADSRLCQWESYPSEFLYPSDLALRRAAALACQNEGCTSVLPRIDLKEL